MVNSTSQMLLFRRAQYCPAPAGDSITRKSIFDSLLAGCVPVIFARASMSQYLWFFTKEEVMAQDFCPQPSRCLQVFTIFFSSCKRWLYTFLSRALWKRMQTFSIYSKRYRLKNCEQSRKLSSASLPDFSIQ